jgi:pimeloyl-ACP methyl ester carboxylesterase
MRAARPTAPVPEATGTIVTYRGQTELVREHWSERGGVLQSEITAGGHRLTVTVSQSPPRLRVDSGGRVAEQEVAPGTLVLENGSWQGLVFASRQAPVGAATPVRQLIPSQGVTLDGVLTVTAAADGGRRVALKVGLLEIAAQVSPAGAFEHGEVPLQGLTARPLGAGPPPAVSQRVPADVRSEPLDVVNAGVHLRGVIWSPPRAVEPVPLALILPGSGPTDRDGNSVLGLHSDLYRQWAEELARAGIATARYDKRGVGTSDVSFDRSHTTVDDFVSDAAAVLASLRADRRFGHITIVGHSEGGLLALLLGSRARLDGLVLCATAGRPVAALLREQVARQLDEGGLAEFDRLLQSVRSGTPLGTPRSPLLQALFAPPSLVFLRSMLDIDPAAELMKLKVPTTILQGTTDVQVTVADARKLAAARPDARLVIVPGANHVFKDEPAATPAQTSYTDPTRPFAPGVITALVSAIVR